MQLGILNYSKEGLFKHCFGTIHQLCELWPRLRPPFLTAHARQFVAKLGPKRYARYHMLKAVAKARDIHTATTDKHTEQNRHKHQNTKQRNPNRHRRAIPTRADQCRAYLRTQVRVQRSHRAQAQQTTNRRVPAGPTAVPIGGTRAGTHWHQPDGRDNFYQVWPKRAKPDRGSHSVPDYPTPSPHAHWAWLVI